MAEEAEEKASNLGGGCPIFSEHIIMEICSRLPLKILIRFSAFANLGLLLFPPQLIFIPNIFTTIITTRTTTMAASCSSTITDLVQISMPYSLSQHSQISSHHLDVPLPDTYMLCPYDGIYFVECNQRFYALWNPATQDYKMLPEIPKPNFPLCRFYYESYGFGFDQIIQGFKVVIIRNEGDRCCGKSFPSEVLIYSSNSNSECYYEVSWDFCVLPPPSTCYGYLNGVYYWKAKNEEDDQFVLSFDMATNLFHRVI